MLTFGLDVPADLAALEKFDPAVLDAAPAIVDDLARGRVLGKLLGDRPVSGHLTGLARVKFDVPRQRPQAFRLVYRQVVDATRHVIAVGVRDEHAAYRAATQRVTPTPQLDRPGWVGSADSALRLITARAWLVVVLSEAECRGKGGDVAAVDLDEQTPYVVLDS